MSGKNKINGADLPSAAEVIASVATPAARPRVETTDDALRLQATAAVMRAGAHAIERTGDIGGAMMERLEAGDMEAAAARYLDPLSHTTRPLVPGNGGEALLMTPDMASDDPRLVDTLTSAPDVLNAEASRARLELASKAGALVLGVDLAETIKARNSLERMLAHQLAALHQLAMRSAGCAGDLLRQHAHTANQAQSIEAARHATTAAKLMAAFQDGYVALDRVRRGGKQTVKVIYQQNRGGQWR
jgi:hypothetical protein